MKRIVIAWMLFSLTPLIASAQTDTLFVYGPGGPFAPMEECGRAFGKANGIVIKVTAGPEGNWIAAAKNNADIIFGGAEYMLTSFAQRHPGLVDHASRKELYKRGAAILVRPGNPKNIRHLGDLARPGIKILDVNGAGQFGLWEDIAGRANLIAGIQQNIRQSFENTALGIAALKSDSAYDAWITYASWHYRLKDFTELVRIPSGRNIYRGTPIALTTISTKRGLAEKFIEYLQSGAGHSVFKKWGWE
ncbi:substrate-binding domain-containing protein [Flavihumibacter stibioxidans]|uniref:Accessory colonization factor AcfC n=1 Tax=Flavihumibacter stibioxidans TaxID=1834163 RepID=A0ABR7M4C2_9BACT|nr:substrate-binding domain-containing protein [Flavihumibacter stibioxidans]MBC6489873.1 hypothetical protein [Flavihumibacter stibioxidans]